MHGRTIELFPKGFKEFVRLFNDGQYWESHEVLEADWRKGKSPFYKGMIIYASAFVHAQRGNPIGVAKQMAKARRYLEPYRPYYLGMDVARLIEHVGRCEAFVDGPTPPRGKELAESFPYDTLELRREWIRGDEVEWGGVS